MKAVRVNEWSQPVELEDVPEPKPASDEVLVRVRAASINPFDMAVYAGYMQSFFSTPLTLGTDFSGEVIAVGSDVTNVKPGDEVYGLVPMHPGAFAEYVIAKSTEVACKPESLSHIEAAGVPLSSLAAYQSLIDIGQAQKGDHVLIIGAGGAVGGTAIQLAKRLGATVSGVDIPEKADFVKSLGADRFIDGKNERYEEIVGPVDLVLDYVGGENLDRSLKVLRDGGRYVSSLAMEVHSDEAEKRGIRTMGLGTEARGDRLEDMAQLIDNGELKTFVNCTFPLEDAQEAFQFRQTTTDIGKIILEID